MQNRLVTLQEMAERLGVSAQTFRRDVRDRSIPHFIVGKRARFDPARVMAYLEAASAAENARPVSNIVPLLKKPKKPEKNSDSSAPVKSRFAAQLRADLPRQKNRPPVRAVPIQAADV